MSTRLLAGESFAIFHTKPTFPTRFWSTLKTGAFGGGSRRRSEHSPPPFVPFGLRVSAVNAALGLLHVEVAAVWGSVQHSEDKLQRKHALPL